MAAVTWSINADFDLDGAYETALATDLEAWSSGISIDRGIDSDGAYQVSQVQFQLGNRAGTYTPENSASALFGQLRPQVPIQLTAVHNAITYTIWTGYITDYENEFEPGGWGSVSIVAQDLAAFLSGYQPLRVTVSTSRDTDGALVAIMDVIGLVAGERNFDDGIQDLNYHFVVGQDALTAMQEVVKSEMGGLLWVQADGKLRFESRQSRLGTSVDDTWGDGTNVVPSRLRYRQTTRDLVTKVNVQATIYQAGQAETEIFRFSRSKDTRPTADSMALAQGQVYTATFNYEGLASAVVTPEAIKDYSASSNAAGTGTDRTSSLTPTVTDHGGSASIKLVNSFAGTIYVTKFRLRGTPVVLAGSRPQFESAKSVPNIKADSGVQLDVPFATADSKAADYSYCTLRTFRYPYPTLELDFPWRNDDTKVAMLSLELGDLIRYTDTGLTTKSAYIDDWWYVERIQISGIRAGEVPVTTVVLTPSYIWRNLDKCAYDLFTRSNAVGDLGTSTSNDTWLEDAGFDIASNKAVPNAVAIATPNIELSAADHVVEVSLSNMSADIDEECGVVYRYQDSSNYWRAFLDGNLLAAQFTEVNGEYLSIADNASLSTGNIDFTMAGWIYADSFATENTFISKESAGGAEFRFGYVIGGGFRFGMFTPGFVSVLASAPGVLPATSMWFFFVAWHDSAADKISVQFNNGVIDSAATAGAAPSDTGGVFQIGSYNGAANLWNGRIANVGFWKRTLTAAEKTWLYNSGSGRRYAELGISSTDGSALKTNLEAYWNLSEQSGTREDSHGNNDLIDNNTVTSNPGPSSTGLSRLEKVVAGAVTSIKTAPWTPTDTAELRVICQGNRHRVWVDFKLVIDELDAALIAATKVGLFSRNTTVVQFDDWYSQALEA